MLKFSKILKDAALYHLADDEAQTNFSLYSAEYKDRFSCCAITNLNKGNRNLADARIHQNCAWWYNEYVLGEAFQSTFGASVIRHALEYDNPNISHEDMYKQSQEIRFMLLMFASYLAEDKGL